MPLIYSLSWSMELVGSFTTVHICASSLSKPTPYNLDSCTGHFSNPVQDKQQMLKGIVSVFIVLTKLPGHVSASKGHLQGVTRST
jgi:hypothetical protein